MDSWNAIKVQINFSYREMAEFRQSKEVLQNKINLEAQTKRLGLGLVTVNDRNSLFQRFAAGEKLFSSVVDASLVEEKHVQREDDYSETEEYVKGRYEVHLRRKTAPIVTQSSLQIVKRMGKYIGLMESLSPVFDLKLSL